MLLLWATIAAQGQTLTPVWVELGEGGRAIARVVVSTPDQCPSIRVGNALRPMLPREPVPPGFRPACELEIPPNTKTASVNGRPLVLPHPDPVRVAVFGDTGCRIKGVQLQDCNDPALWPFQTVAGAAAAVRPNLVIHVGDYLYREDPCPRDKQGVCGGSPSGDNWGAWNADFFKPAAKLLAAAPWMFVRGNHENCQRSWRGWFYYLDPRPWTGMCENISRPYSVELGKFQAINFDSSAVNDNQSAGEQTAAYSSQLASLHARNAWLVDHHPFWGVRAGVPNQPPAVDTVTLQQAWEKAAPQGIDMVLSGHTHLFEVLSYGGTRPVQIVAGDGGTKLSDPIPAQVNGMDIHGVVVAESENRQAFGYTLFTRQGAGWEMRLTSPDKDSGRHNLVTCQIQGREAKCAGRVVKISSRRPAASGTP
ncbi:MAG: metallophosphoesterase [Bryobacterales bacterium]|nr:metallophosphoesterase [Bryobacterales bacterium]